MRLAPVLVLFFFSGLAALSYEVVWIRLLSLTLSVTVYALTTVLCAFMAGMGLGAALAGRIADRLKRPLVAFGIAEIGISFAQANRGCADGSIPAIRIGKRVLVLRQPLRKLLGASDDAGAQRDSQPVTTDS